MSNYPSYENMTTLMQGISDRFNSMGGAYIFRGSVTFANLPSTPTRQMAGFTYNVSEDFTTDARFIEGAGKKYPAGTNVSVADQSVDTYSAVTPVGNENPRTQGWYERTGTSPDYVYYLTTDTTVQAGKTYYSVSSTVSVKYDVVGSFYDIDKLLAMIAGTFDATQAYSEDDVVIYEGGLYKFKTDHAVGAWDPTEVDSKTVAELIAEAEPSALTTAQVNALLALLN